MTLSEVKVIEIPIAEFLAMKPAPGHRDSEGRAIKATHLHKLIPEHLHVEIAQYPDAGGNVVRESMTGNTRRQVWKCGLSDRVPDSVRGNLYTMRSEEEVKERMLFHDSVEAAWNSRDHAHRALNMNYADGWKPVSKALRNKGGGIVNAIRQVSAIVYNNRATPDTTIRYEIELGKWRDEYKQLDAILDVSPAEAIHAKRPFTFPFTAACLLLLRFQDHDKVQDFVRAILADEGTKNADGQDGIYVATENFGQKGKPDETFRGILGAFDFWAQKECGTLSRARKTDPLKWVAKQREIAKGKKTSDPAATEAAA